MKTFLKFVSAREWWIAAIMLTVYFVLCIFYAVHLGDRVRYPDEKDYITIAEHLTVGHGYTLDGNNPTAYRAPGFTLLVATGLSGGGILAARILNMICFTGCLGCVFILARRIAGSLGGICAIMAGMLYPVMFYTAGTLYPQTLGSLLLLCSTSIIFGKPLTVMRAVLCGLIGSLLMLTIPSMIFFWGCLMLSSLFPIKRHNVNMIVLTGICSLLLLSVWFARNYRQFDSCFFVSTNSGINLLLGNSENTTPNAGVNVDLSEYSSDLNEIQKDRHYRSSAIQYMRANPLHSMKLYCLKFLNYFNYRNKLFVASEGSQMRDIAMLITYGGLLLFSIIRLVLIKRIPLSRFELFAFCAYVMNGAFAAVFFTRIRFRLPFDWLLVCIAGIALSHLVHAISESRWSLFKKKET